MKQTKYSIGQLYRLAYHYIKCVYGNQTLYPETKMIFQTQIVFEIFSLKGYLSFVINQTKIISPFGFGSRAMAEPTHRQRDIRTYRLNCPRSRFSEKRRWKSQIRNFTISKPIVCSDCLQPLKNQNRPGTGKKGVEAGYL